MRILVACEESQTVTKEFRALGHDAHSCDIQACSGGHPEWHFVGNVLDYLNFGWDMMIAFPPCTYLSYAGNRSWNEPGRLLKRLEALSFFVKLWLSPIDKICIENPKGCASPTIAKYSQMIHPYYFGDSYSKPTFLFLKNLPILKHHEADNLFDKKTHVHKGDFVEYNAKERGKKKSSRWYNKGGKDRQKNRSKTFPGIARAMSNQWS